MPPKEVSVPSAGDLKFFTAIFKFIPSGLDLDWTGLANELGLKNAAIARTRFGQIRGKYQGDSNGNSPQKNKVTRVVKSFKGKNAKVGGRNRKKNISSEDEEEDMKVTVKKEPEDDDDDDAKAVKVEDDKDEI